MSGVVKVHNKAGVHWLLVDLEDFAKAEFVDVIGVSTVGLAVQAGSAAALN